MQKAVEKIVLLPDYTLLETKIAKGFPYMKASEWKSWCLVYSPVVLKDVLPLNKFRNWILFVKACRILVMPNVCKSDISSAHKYLENFCKECETLYSLDLISPNMHLHLHLQATIRNFGPVYSYWLFSFERYNSILKNIKTNRKTEFELTYTRQFVEDVYKQDIISHIMESTDTHTYMDIFQKNHKTSTKSSINNNPILSILFFTRQLYYCYAGCNKPLPLTAFPLAKKLLSLMPTPEYSCLVDYYQVAYNDGMISSCKNGMTSLSFVNDRIEILKSINILGQVYKECNGNGRGSYIQALFEENCTNAHYGYVGEIQYIFVHSFTPTNSLTAPSNQNHEHIFAFVRWFKTTSDTHRQPKGIEIYHANFYKLDFQISFLLSVLLGINQEGSDKISRRGTVTFFSSLKNLGILGFAFPFAL
ncbi:hypothetical protein PHYBLDRAFT_67275 [Phycomyces blakesleeanus NRRL 1555(-)]|uniref:Transposase domain-containing protein n=1 Tax=Phycomyces blakesleeanus (strain ATCC 8743b / DSM 1359 / FGSC 10004 / NBRC 33097 / NRRL 1555) TaxID=763407 RepID=A0A162TA47_PHYB8|nr:hypothetical protein PHYBLDRAFT_67275 [Phycomyces blakesleeanus NRRL 1555(-)]OAD67142.1 hypothetical protein PHYBLDRAFT_67275 [Phycomyces blakesleeanus NRRL 1555(-)]|eukprot:XP_018285182.1 hypothetical protein PHYBLDRAFT_67275 [Phycomyces blakesleeanus NRRL 1555(-)]